MDRSILDEIASATRLKEGSAGVEAVVRAVHRGGTIRLQDAARAARLPLPLATAVRRELEKRGILAREAGLTLTSDGRAWVEDALGLVPVPDVACPTCGGGGLVLTGPYLAAKQALDAHMAAAPPTDVTLDQAPCTTETTLRRVAAMQQAGSIEGRRILILGDDDSVSLGLALLGKSVGVPLARQITVLEVDPARASFIEAVSDAERLPITVVRHDLRDPLPRDIEGTFDVVETDPPYTLEGALLFLTRAREGLENGRGDVYFSFAHWPPGRMLELMQVCLDLGLAIRAVRPGFNAYQGATVLAGSGQLIELSSARPVALKPRVWEGPLYTADLNPRERAYTCTKCGKTVQLGMGGMPATIEALKARGCPNCGSPSFARARARR